MQRRRKRRVRSGEQLEERCCLSTLTLVEHQIQLPTDFNVRRQVDLDDDNALGFLGQSS